MRRAADLYAGAAKTDPRDAWVLADYARRNPDRLQWTEISDELLIRLRVLNGHDTDLAGDANRTINRCRDALLALSPALERVLGQRLTQPGVRDLLAKWPTPTALATAGRTKIRNAIGKRSPRMATTLTTHILAALDAQAVTLPAESTWGEVITNLVTDLGRIQTRHRQLMTQIEEAFLHHPLGQVLNSLPGFGPRTGARTLAEIGGDPYRFKNGSRLASYAGFAPVNHRSGRSINRTSQHRGGNHRLKNAMFLAAFVASRHDPTAKAYYQRKPSEGKHHNAAVICVARRRCDLILAMLKTKTPYNPDHPKTNLTNRQKHPPGLRFKAPGSCGSVRPVSLAIELVGITKRYPGVIANDRINLAVQEGEIHAVVGENGAGKSTLMKILYGMIPPDEGEIRIRGEATTMSSARDAIEAGIGMVHQHFMLAEQMTVMENVILGAEPRQGLKIDFGEARRRIAEISGEGALDADQMVEELSVGEKQRVEIAKVLFRGAQILILDEPTAVLVPQEVEELFVSLRELRKRGVTIIFISHKLDEVLDIADSITVIRAGRTVATADPRRISTRELAELMVGAELPTAETSLSTVTDQVLLQAEGVGTLSEDGDRWVIEDISLRIHRGQVLGIAGVEGNGQRELVDILMGLRPADSGRVLLSGKEITAMSTLRRREAGIGLIPADRHGRGLLLGSPLWENAMLGYQSQPPFTRGWLVDGNGARRRTEDVVEQFDVRTPGVEVKIHALSGGNQQKLLVGKEMLATPQVLLASHPTRGIDVGAQAAVWESIRTARAEGLGVLLISADLDELIGLSDTLMVILRGRLVATLDPRQVTPAELGSYMTGASQ